MANTMYSYAKAQLLDGVWSWSGSDFFGCLTSATYTPIFATDASDSVFTSFILSSVTAQLSGLSVSTAGVASANSLTLTGIAASLTATWVVVFFNNGVVNFPILADNVGTGLPYTTLGTNITIDWNGATPSGPLFTL
jgi:hypothetical protein